MALTSLDPLLNVYSAETRKEIVQILLKRGFFKEKKVLTVYKKVFLDYLPFCVFAIIALGSLQDKINYGALIASVMLFMFLLLFPTTRASKRISNSQLTADERGIEWSKNGNVEWACEWSQMEHLRQGYRPIAETGFHNFLSIQTASGPREFPVLPSSEQECGGMLLRLLCRPPVTQPEAGRPLLVGLGVVTMLALAALYRVLLLRLPPGFSLGALSCVLFTLQWIAALIVAMEIRHSLQSRFLRERLRGWTDLPAETYANWIERYHLDYEIDEGVSYAVPAPILNILTHRNEDAASPGILVCGMAIIALIFDLILSWGANSRDHQQQLGMAAGILMIIYLLSLTWGSRSGKPSAILTAAFSRSGEQITVAMPGGKVLKTNEKARKEASLDLLYRTYKVGSRNRSLPIGILEPIDRHR